MKLNQLRYLCTVVDESFSITRAAAKLHTSQPAISKQIQLLEEELRSRLLVRRRNRTVALSDAGIAILPLARRMLKEAETLKQLATDAADPAKGQVTIATTHVHARHSLPPVFRLFRARYPKVRICLQLGTPRQIAYWVSSGDADLGVGIAATAGLPGLVSIPCFRMGHSIAVPPRHPLLAHPRPPLELIVAHPFVSTGPESRLSAMIADRCASFGLQPDIVMHVSDIEVAKAYVEAGFGIAVLPTLALGSRGRLRAIDAGHVFEPVIASIVMQDDLPARGYVADLVDLIAPRQRGVRRIRELPGATAHP